MSYTELKRATLQRNQLDPTSRIPGTYRTVVTAHLLCFAAALPAVITSPANFPKVLVAATVDRGLRETVAKRNVSRVFQILFIETVRAPPPRATETTVSMKKTHKKRKKNAKKNAQRRAKPIETVRALLSPAFS